MTPVAQSAAVTIDTLCGVKTPPGAVEIASEAVITRAIAKLAKEIAPWIDANLESPVVMVALLEGGRFYADHLIAQLRTTCAAHFSRLDLKASTRDGDGRPLDEPLLTGNVEALKGRRVLIVDDILDSGTTLRLVMQTLRPLVTELKTTVLIQKDDPTFQPEELNARPAADFVGLRFRDSRWFSGAGMDMPGDTSGVVRNSRQVIAYPPVF